MCMDVKDIYMLARNRNMKNDKNHMKENKSLMNLTKLTYGSVFNISQLASQ